MNNNTLINKNLLAILENLKLAKRLIPTDQVLIHEIKAAKRIFVMAAGRSGLALKMAAMRFMHGLYCIHSRRNYTCYS
jgi:6-phospho-3-hexuloisomerase